MGVHTPKRVLVCGGGNSAHVLAGILSHRPDKYTVNILTMYDHEADHWKKVLGDTGDIRILFDTGEEVHGRPAMVTDKPEQAVPGADIIVLSVPSTAHEMYLKAISKHIVLKDEQHRIMLGAMPCRGGFDWSVRSILGDDLNKKIDVFGTVTLPWACRIEHWGDAANVLGTKKSMDMVVTPKENCDRVREQLQDMLGKYPVLHDKADVSFLSLSLLNFWHPAIIYGQFKDWDLKSSFSEKPLFYAGITDNTAQLLVNISDETLAIRKALEDKYPGLNLEYCKDTREWFLSSYEGSIENMNEGFGAMIRSNKPYQGLTHPMKQSGDGSGYVPDFQHRYMSEDLPNGIAVIRGLGELAGVAMPYLDQVLEWCQVRSGKE